MSLQRARHAGDRRPRRASCCSAAGAGIIARWLTNPQLADTLPAARCVPGADADVGGLRDRPGVAQATRGGGVHLRGLGHRPRRCSSCCRRLRSGACAACSAGAVAFARAAPGRHAVVALARVRRRPPARRRRSGGSSGSTRCRSRWPSASKSCRSTSTSTSSPLASTPATFAIYAVGCLQIPLVDLIVTSTRERDDGEDGRAGSRARGRGAGAVARHHGRLALRDLPAGGRSCS